MAKLKVKTGLRLREKLEKLPTEGALKLSPLNPDAVYIVGDVIEVTKNEAALLLEHFADHFESIP